MKDIFAAELGTAKDKPAMIALAKDLLQRGKEEQDALAKFSLLYESRALLVDAPDLVLALEATDELSAWFEVDPWSLKCDTLTKLATTAKADVERHPIATVSLELADEAISNSDWASAEKLLAAATRANARLNGPVGELKRLEGHTAEVTSLDVSSSGALLVSRSTVGTVRFWDLAEGKETG